MVRDKVSKGDLTGLKLLEVSARIFRQRGYMATTIRDIAAATGVKPGSIYYHYASKDAILEAVIDRAQTALTESVTSALAALGPDTPFPAKLKAAIEAHLTAHHKFGDFAVASREGLDRLPNDRRKVQRAKRVDYGRIWRSLFEDAIADGELAAEIDVVPIQMFIFGALNWTSEWLDPRRRSLAEASDVLADVLLNGLPLLDNRGRASVPQPKATAARRRSAVRKST